MVPAAKASRSRRRIPLRGRARTPGQGVRRAHRRIRRIDPREPALGPRSRRAHTGRFESPLGSAGPRTIGVGRGDTPVHPGGPDRRPPEAASHRLHGTARRIPTEFTRPPKKTFTGRSTSIEPGDDEYGGQGGEHPLASSSSAFPTPLRTRSSGTNKWTPVTKGHCARAKHSNNDRFRTPWITVFQSRIPRNGNMYARCGAHNREGRNRSGDRAITETNTRARGPETAFRILLIRR